MCLFGPEDIVFVGQFCDLFPGLSGKENGKTSKGISKSKETSFSKPILKELVTSL